MILALAVLILTINLALLGRPALEYIIGRKDHRKLIANPVLHVWDVLIRVAMLAAAARLVFVLAKLAPTL